MLALVCPALFADTLQFSSGVYPEYGSYYVGPYTMIYTPTGSTTGQYLDLWCVSFYENQTSGAWPVTLVNETGVTPYEQYAWLAMSVGSTFDGFLVTNDIATWAIWYLVDPTDVLAYWKTNGFPTSFTSDVVSLADNAGLYTGTITLYQDSGIDQNMIGVGGVPVPEPNSIILLGLAVLVIGFAVKRCGGLA
jgi:hypothetical protein